MLDTSLLSVFLVGLFGGLHCAGMCGGIVGAMGIAARTPMGRAVPIPVVAAPRAAGATRIARLLAYNAGRLSSYIVAGALVGGIGSSAWMVSRLLPVQQVAFILTNLTLVMLGLYLSGILRSIAAIEVAGRGVWRAVGPAAARALRGESVGRAYCAGLLWGLVPCGMVYAVLLAALTSGSMIDGALLMAAFGFGTLPNLLALGWSAGRLAGWLGRPWLKRAAGVLIIAFGIMGLLRLDPIAHLHGAASFCFSALESLGR